MHLADARRGKEATAEHRHDTEELWCLAPCRRAAEAWQAPLRDICAAAAAAGCGPPTLARLAASRLLLTAPVACLRVRAREQAASYSACGACRLACRSGAGA